MYIYEKSLYSSWNSSLNVILTTLDFTDDGTWNYTFYVLEPNVKVDARVTTFLRVVLSFVMASGIWQVHLIFYIANITKGNTQRVLNHDINGCNIKKIMKIPSWFVSGSTQAHWSIKTKCNWALGIEKLFEQMYKKQYIFLIWWS